MVQPCGERADYPESIYDQSCLPLQPGLCQYLVLSHKAAQYKCCTTQPLACKNGRTCERQKRQKRIWLFTGPFLISLMVLEQKIGRISSITLRTPYTCTHHVPHSPTRSTRPKKGILPTLR